MRMDSVFGAPRSASRATTATGSVALIMLPNVRATGQDQPYGTNANFTNVATRAVEITTPGPARYKICAIERRNT